MLDHQVEGIALGLVDHHLAHARTGVQQGTHPLSLFGITELPHPQGHPIPAQGSLQFGRGALGDHPAGFDDGQLIRQGIHLFEVVAAEQHRGAAVAQLAQHRPDHGPTLDVEAHGGLIEHQYLGPMQQPGGQIEAAPHTAGIAAATAVDPVGHAEQLDQLVNSLAA